MSLSLSHGSTHPLSAPAPSTPGAPRRWRLSCVWPPLCTAAHLHRTSARISTVVGLGIKGFPEEKAGVCGEGGCEQSLAHEHHARGMSEEEQHTRAVQDGEVQHSPTSPSSTTPSKVSLWEESVFYTAATRSPALPAAASSSRRGMACSSGARWCVCCAARNANSCTASARALVSLAPVSRVTCSTQPRHRRDISDCQYRMIDDA